MPDYSAGTASIRVKPSFLGFATTVESELRRYDFHLDINIGADTRVAAAEIENLRRIARENATFRVDANTATAAAEIEALRRAAQENMTLRPDLDRNAANRTRSAAQRNAAQIRRDLEKALGGLQNAATINLKVLGVLGAAGVVTDLLAIGDAAVKASRSLALLPAIGFAGLAGVAGVATGISGIAGAFKATSAASKDAANDVASQRDALSSLTEAQYQAKQSQQGVSDAYRDASRSIRDMNNDLTDQKFATQDAALSVQEAAQRLQKVQFDPTADATQRARAKLTYDEAVQRLKEQQNKTQDLQQDTDTANTKGVEGSKQVTDAKHAELRALEELRKAQETAAKPSSSQTKLDEAMAKLSPNAKELVNDIRGLGPAWTDARKASQDALTDGMGPAVQHLAATQLPNLRAGLVGVNTAINGGLRASIAALSSDTNKADFKTSLDNTATGFANAAKGSAAWTNGLTKLVTVGSSFLPKFGDEIANLATRFDNLIQRTAADGSLKKWIQDGLDAGKQLFDIIGHVGSSILSVFEAAGDDGSTLKKLDDLTERMSKFLKSTDGQGELKAFFASARESFDKMKPVLADLPDILKGVFAGFQAWSGIALPFLEAAGDLLAAHPGLVQDVVIAYLAFKTVGPVIDLVRIALANSSTALANFRGGISGATGAAGSAVGGLGGLLGAAGPLGAVALALGVGAGLTYLTTKHQDAARAADEQRQKEQALRDTLDKPTGQVTQATIDAAAHDLQDTGFFTRAKSFGIDPRTFVNASLGLAQADKAAINNQLTGTIVESLGRDDRFSGQTGTKKRFASAGLTDQDVAQALAGAPEAVKKYSDAIARYNAALPANASKLALPDLAAMKTELDDVGESAATLAGRMNGYTTTVGELGTKQAEFNTATHDTFRLTEQGTKQFEALGAAVQQVPDAKTVYVKALTAEQQQAVEKLGDTVERLPNGNVKINLNDEQARADITAITTAPYSATVKVNFVWPNGIAGSLSEGTLSRLHEDVSGIVPGRAGGGFLPTTGPGTNTRDGFLGVLASGMPIARLDGGEGITRTEMAEKYRRELTQINAGTFPKLPGYADGGFVDERPQPARIGDDGNIVYPDQAGIGKQSPIGRTGALVSYMQSRDGAPYGGNEDCSGYISEGANVAVGLSPNQGRMSTSNEGTWLDALGFQSGPGVPGSFRVGWVNDASMPAGGHTAGTLPNNVNVESGGATGKVMYGGQAIGAGASMFTQHAYLIMDSSTSGIPGDSSTITGQPQLYPQAALPGRATDAQLSALSGKAAVDSANSERNAVYANPASTAQDKLASDIKYQQAQNALESSTKSGDNSAISLQGIFSKAGGILAAGILSGLGLENSILSDSNVYNRSFNTLADRFGPGAQLGGGYGYTPQNLPSIATTSTPQSSANVNDPSLATQIPGSGPITGGLAVNPDLGAINLTVPGRSGYAIGAGAAQWKGLATQMLAREGFSTGQVDIMLAQIQSESGGDAGIAQQITDINGTGESAGVGLLQVIPSTFAAYRDPGLPNDRRDPAANMAAALRYYKATYGTDLSAMWGQGHGYDDGGIASGIGMMLKQTIRPERVLSPRQTETFDSALPLLESINASTWSPNRVNSDSFNAPTAQVGRGDNNFSPTINARVADVGDLVDLVERQAQMRSIGLMAAL